MRRKLGITGFILLIFIGSIASCVRARPDRRVEEADKLVKDPGARERAHNRARYWLEHLKAVGVSLPEVTPTLAENEPFRIALGWPDGLEWNVDFQNASVSITERGDLIGISFHTNTFEHFHRAEADPEDARFLENADELSTESMRASNELILKTLMPGDWDDYRLQKESISYRKWRVGEGHSSDQFWASYWYRGTQHGLLCDGKNVYISYDRITGCLAALNVNLLDAKFPHPNEITLTLEEAKVVAKKHLLDAYSTAAEAIPACGITKLTFANIDGTKNSANPDPTKPRIAHKIRVYWTPADRQGWYMDDVTVNAMNGELLDLTHYMVIYGGKTPPNLESACEDMW